MEGNIKQFAVLTAALVLAMLIIIVFTRPAVSKTQESSAQTDLDSLTATKYAAEFDTSKQKALKQLELQPLVGKLNATLTEKEQNNFAGLYIEHEPEYRIVAKFTKNGKEEIKPYVDEGRLENNLEVTPAEVTLEELEEAHARVSHILEAIDVQADSWVDVENNLVKIHVADLPGLNKSLKDESLQFPDRVKVAEVPALSAPEVSIFAGLSMSSACTTGFAVKHSWGGRGVLTAGHCGNTASVRGVPLGNAIFEQQSGSYDMQFHQAPKHVEKPLVRDAGGSSVIKRTRPRSLQIPGQFVCHTGVATGTRCGVIVTNTAKPGYLQGGNSTFVMVKKKGPARLSAPGDSGGPWFAGSTALSVHVVGTPGTIGGFWYSFYMPINFPEKRGFTVMTG